MSLWAFPSSPPSLLPVSLPLKGDSLYFPGCPEPLYLSSAWRQQAHVPTSRLTGSEQRKGHPCLCLWWAVHICLLQRGSKEKTHRTQSLRILQGKTALPLYSLSLAMQRELRVSDWLQKKGKKHTLNLRGPPQNLPNLSLEKGSPRGFQPPCRVPNRTHLQGEEEGPFHLSRRLRPSASYSRLVWWRPLVRHCATVHPTLCSTKTRTFKACPSKNQQHTV